MQQPYPAYGQYDRTITYNNVGYNNMNRVPTGHASPAATMYNRNYPMQNYNQGYNYPDYPQAGSRMYNVPAAPGFPVQDMNYMNGIGRGRGGAGYYQPANAGYAGKFRGGRGIFSQKKKPFVGGSLETQREWERQTECCFFKQGKCKFGDRCRFLHQENSTLPCQFGENCRMHSAKAKEAIAEDEANRKEEAEAPSHDNAEATEPSKEQEC